MITYDQFFTDYFPSVYVCAMNDRGVIYGCIPDQHLDTELASKFKYYNDQGAGIFFTPNAVTYEEKKHKLENFKEINAWYIDIDIQETKGAEIALSNEEQKRIREDKKASIRGAILFAPIQPSMVIESRNGFHLYWFAASAKQSNFRSIEMGIYESFKQSGADISSIKIVTLLRLPGFYNTKYGEKFKVEIDETLSARYQDGSFKCYSENEMLKAYPYVENSSGEVSQNNESEQKVKVYRPPKIISYGKSDIFKKVHALPVKEVIERLSGHNCVRGEKFGFIKVQNGKHENITVDGRSVNCWIDHEKNQIFGPKGSGNNGPTITQWIKWYGIENAEIAKLYKELFIF